MKSQTLGLEATLDQKTDGTFQEASTQVDQAMMKTEDKMDSGAEDFRQILSGPQEMEKQVEQLKLGEQ